MADKRANRRATADSPAAGASHVRSANAAYASTPSGSVIAELMTTWSAIPGSNRIGPNPVSSPNPTQPPQIDTNAPSAITTNGHDPNRDRHAGPGWAVLVGCWSGAASGVVIC